MEELPPIFKNVEITMDDIGDYMRDFITDNCGSADSKPRRSLISSYFADKMLIATPLLK
jgi:hypothetical protein